MSTDISPENERFIEDSVQNGLFADRGAALDEAVELLKRRVALLAHIDEGTRQLRTGQGIEIEGDEALRAFMEEIKAEGLRRYEADRAGK